MGSEQSSQASNRSSSGDSNASSGSSKSLSSTDVPLHRSRSDASKSTDRSESADYEFLCRSESADYEFPRRHQQKRSSTASLTELLSSLMTSGVEMKQLIEVVETFLKLLKQLQRLRIDHRSSRSAYPSETPTPVNSASSSLDGLITPPNRGFAPKRPNKTKRSVGCFPKVLMSDTQSRSDTQIRSAYAYASLHSIRSWDSDATLNDCAYVDFNGFSNRSEGKDDDEAEDYTVNVYLPSDDDDTASSDSSYLFSGDDEADYRDCKQRDYLTVEQLIAARPDLYRDFYPLACKIYGGPATEEVEVEPEQEDEPKLEHNTNSMSSDDLGDLFDEAKEEEKVARSRSLDSADPPSKDSSEDEKSQTSSRSA